MLLVIGDEMRGKDEHHPLETQMEVGG